MIWLKANETNPDNSPPTIRISSQDFWKIFGSLLQLTANAIQQIPGFDGNGNVPPELVMTNPGIPLTGSVAIGFTIVAEIFGTHR